LPAYDVTVVEEGPILSAEYRLPLLAKNNPPCSAVSICAIAELLVQHKCEMYVRKGLYREHYRRVHPFNLWNFGLVSAVAITFCSCCHFINVHFDNSHEIVHVMT